MATPLRRQAVPAPSNSWVELARRAVWVPVHLVLVTLLVFASVGRSESQQWPLFLNTEPIYPGPRAWQLVEAIGLGLDSHRDAATELLQLGGASLPHVLPKLDSLEPGARIEVLRALAPLAVRMQLRSSPPTARESESLWLSFWNDHFVDFHPAMARRVVRRFVQGPTHQRAQEVRRLDTFALDELVRELARLGRERAQPATVRPLVELMCEIATLPDAPCPAKGAGDVRSLVEQWRAWWLRAHYRFEAPNGVERFLAPLLQTEYATWLRRTTRAIVTGRAFAGLPWNRFWLTATELGVAVAVAWQLTELIERKRWGGAGTSKWITVASCLVLSVPLLIFAPGGAALHGAMLTLLVVSSGVATGLWATMYRRVSAGYGFSVSGVHIHVSWILGSIVASEHLCNVDGLGSTLIAALLAKDLQTTIWTALGCAGLTGLAHAIVGQLARRAVRSRGNT